MNFGEKLKRIREDRHLSQEEMARILHTSKQVISRYELGQTTPKITVAAKWCEILNINLDNMLNDGKDVYELPARNVPAENITANEQKLLDLFRELNDEGQEAALAMLTGFATQPIYKKHSSPSVDKKQA